MDIEKLELEAAQKLCELIYKPGAWNGLDDVDQRLYRRDARAVLAIALAAAAAETAKQAQFTDDPKHDHWAQACEEVSDRLRTLATQLGTHTDG